jgi:hypothetical protein
MNKVTTILAALAVVMLGTSTFAAIGHMDLGGDIKMMGYYGENVFDFSDDFDDQDTFMRMEAHLWFQADLSDNVMTKISMEIDRRFDGQSYEGTYYDYIYGDGGEYPELSQSPLYEYYKIGASDDLDIFLEEAFIQMSKMYDSEFNLKLGRQFIQLGDGFMIGDSDPFSELSLNTKGEYEVDPFDALVGWYDGEDWVLNLIYAKVAETGIARDDSEAWIAYFTYSGMEEFIFDIYFIYANMETDYLLSSFGASGAEDADLFAIGGRIAGTAVESLSYKLEGVYEFGEIEWGSDDADIQGWALEAGLKYVFESDYNPWIGGTYVFESGDDDVEDDDLDMFVPLFENRTYGEILDGFTSTNVHVFNIGGGFNITPELSLYGNYYYIMAAEDEVYDGEDDIGHEFDAYLDYTITEEATAMLAGGFAAPGDALEYGEDEDNDTAYFVRAGVKVEF